MQSELEKLSNALKDAENNIFSNEDKIKDNFNHFVEPYLYLYKPIIHECTRNIILSKTINRYHENMKQDLKEIHKEIATEMNLSTIRHI